MPASKKAPGVSFLVLNYNDRERVEGTLKALYGALKGYKGPTEVIVVDNASTDDSLRIVEAKFPRARIVRCKENRIALSFNEAVPHAKYDLLFLLTGDMLVTPGFLEPLVRHFKDEGVFAATPTILGPDRKTVQSSRTAGERFFGFIRVRWNRGVQGNGPQYIFCSPLLGVFDRKKWLAIGGIDPIYQPTYWDDIDLSYCAWKRGWKVLYEPSSTVVHDHSGTVMKKYGRREALRIDLRNRHLFIWKNVTKKTWLLSYILLLPAYLVAGTLLRGTYGMSAFASALKRMPRALDRRKEEEKHRKLSDDGILRMSASDYRPKSL